MWNKGRERLGVASLSSFVFGRFPFGRKLCRAYCDTAYLRVLSFNDLSRSSVSQSSVKFIVTEFSNISSTRVRGAVAAYESTSRVSTPHHFSFSFLSKLISAAVYVPRDFSSSCAVRIQRSPCIFRQNRPRSIVLNRIATAWKKKSESFPWSNLI